MIAQFPVLSQIYKFEDFIRCAIECANHDEDIISGATGFIDETFYCHEDYADVEHLMMRYEGI